MNNGLIVYSFKKKQPDEVPVPVPVPEEEKYDNYVYMFRNINHHKRYNFGEL